MNIEINVENIGEYLKELEKDYKNYEENVSNLFLTLKATNTYWHDATARKFFTSIEQEKTNQQQEILNINNKLEVYRFIYRKYTELGKKIKCNLSNKDNVIAKFNQCINISSNLIKSYKSLNMYFSSERYSLINEKNKIIACYNTLLESKQKVEKTYKKIEEIETQVSNKISKLAIINIEEYDNTDYII